MSNLVKSTLFILAFFVLVSCDKEEETPTPDKNTGTTDSSSVEVPANAIDPVKILAIINRYRTAGCKCGEKAQTPMPAVKAIIWNKQLENAAILHSKDMIENDYFDHTSQDGTEFHVRAKNAGYKGFASLENIYGGGKEEEEIIKGWIESEGHCKGLMAAEVTETAVGTYGKGDYPYYSTMVSGVAK